MNEQLSRMLRRPIDEVAGRLPVGSPAMCQDLIAGYREAGLQRMLFWPLKDEVAQLERLATDILPVQGSRRATDR